MQNINFYLTAVKLSNYPSELIYKFDCQKDQCNIRTKTRKPK